MICDICNDGKRLTALDVALRGHAITRLEALRYWLRDAQQATLIWTDTQRSILEAQAVLIDRTLESIQTRIREANG